MVRPEVEERAAGGRAGPEVEERAGPEVEERAAQSAAVAEGGRGHAGAARRRRRGGGPRVAQSERRQRAGGATRSTAAENGGGARRGHTQHGRPEDRAAWRQGRGRRRGQENEEKRRGNRPNPRGKDLWSRFQPRTGTKDPLVTNRDQRSVRAAKYCARSPAGLWSRLVLRTGTNGLFFLVSYF